MKTCEKCQQELPEALTYRTAPTAAIKIVPKSTFQIPVVVKITVKVIAICVAKILGVIGASVASIAACFGLGWVICYLAKKECSFGDYFMFGLFGFLILGALVGLIYWGVITIKDTVKYELKNYENKYKVDFRLKNGYWEEK